MNTVLSLSVLEEQAACWRAIDALADRNGTATIDKTDPEHPAVSSGRRVPARSAEEAAMLAAHHAGIGEAHTCPICRRALIYVSIVEHMREHEHRDTMPSPEP